MTGQAGLAIVINGTSRLGLIAVDALARSGRAMLVVGPGAGECLRDRHGWHSRVKFLDAHGASETDWSRILAAAQAASGLADTLVVSPPDDGPSEDSYRAISTAWLGAKHSLALFRPTGRGSLLTLGFAAPGGGACPGQDAACESIRLLTSAALHDARASGIVLRSNRLFCAADANAGSMIETIRFLTGDDSRFMSGAEILLPAATRQTGAASPGLAGKSVLVTGATSGIGRATAVEIGRRGGWVAVGGRKLDLANATLELVREAGGDGCVVALDVTDEEAWTAVARQIGEARGFLHGLVNNAGEARNRPIESLSEADLAFLAGINCRGVKIGMEAMAPLLAKEGGVILNISSVAGVRAGPGGSAYSATKAAMIGLSRGYAQAYAARGVPIRVNSLQPGLIWSDSVADALGDEGARQFRAMIEPKTPLGRVGTPEEVAQSVAFLLSDAAASISGQAINISGGLELSWP